MSVFERLFSDTSYSPVDAQQATLDAIARETFADAVAPSRRVPAASLAVPQGRQAAQLDKGGATLTPPPVREEVQITRWRLKHHVANLLRTPGEEKCPGVCVCGAAGHDKAAVSLVRREGRPGLTGVLFCDSPWLCPTCAPRRAAERAERVQGLFDAVERKKGTIVFVTLTVRHTKGQSLADLKKLVSEAGLNARRGAPWERKKKAHQILGVVASPEVTYGRYGWHFHIHLGLVMLESDHDVAEEVGNWFVDRYRDYIGRAGGRADRQAQDVQAVWRREDVATYLAKGSAAWEIASAGATKAGRKGWTPWDLAALAAKGDARAASRFREYAAVMPGTRSCVISKSLAEKAGVAAHDDADRSGVEEAQPQEELVGVVATPRWHLLLRRGHVADILKLVGDGATWPTIEGTIGRLLRDAEPPSALLRRRVEHAPLAAAVAAQAAAEAVFFRGRKGQALQVVLERERETAQRQGRTFVPPDLREVMRLLAA